MTTRALKLRFLPPLTTLVTRLIDTTVSFSSKSDGSIFSRCCAISELQSGFARRFGDRADTSVIQIAAAVEHDSRDATLLQALGDHPSEHLGARNVAAARRAGKLRLQPGLGARRRTHGPAGEIVDHLCGDVRHRSEHREARSRLSSMNALPLPQPNPIAPIFLRPYLHLSVLEPFEPSNLSNHSN